MSKKKFNENTNLNLYDVSKDIISFWKKNKIFEKSIENRKDSKVFSFYEGPPSANGLPGIHHVMARTVKDVFCRYKTIKGFKVNRKGGWDTHGLPVELQVEKTLGITKDDIGTKISVEDYNHQCREAVMRYKEKWEELTEKIGFWLDVDDAYITFENNYIESVWWSIKELYKKGLLYKGYTIQPYSPAAGTGLSSHELNMPGAYKEIKDTSLTAQFKIKPNKDSIGLFGNDDIYILAWTTTPWTLPANNGLAVGKKLNYVLVETFNKYTKEKIKVILAKECINKFFSMENCVEGEVQYIENKLEFKIIKEIKGSELCGLDYHQLLPYIKIEKPALTIIHADFVSTEEGTGIVHISLTFGSDDFTASKKNEMPGVFVDDENGDQIPIVDRNGKFVKEIKDFAGLEVKNFSDKPSDDLTTDEKISIKLKKENKAFDVKKYVHSYPHCWRTDKPILYYPLESWFINTTKLKSEFISKNKKINWQPESTGTGRFGNWLENLVDWNLSRSRYWGTPLPIWRTENGQEEKCIGSINELRTEVEKSCKAGYMKQNLAEDFDLHRPYVDDIILVSENNKPMYREKDIIDVWYDSGAVPFAQYHYPFENKDFFKDMFPADFIAEGVDQTRGWFFTLHAISIMLFGKSSFKNVISNGLVLDRDGNKMSKRLGNAVDPFEIIKKYGPDAARWYMMVNSNPWDNLKFNEDGISEVSRKFFGTLLNTYSFFALYANIDQFTGSESIISYSKRTFDDRWIISKLNSLKNEVDNSMERYNPTKAARLISDFLNDDLSNWYVRLNRKRFWVGDLTEDKLMAYQTLYECLKTISVISSPFIPFFSERLYNDLCLFSGGPESVHLVDFPESKLNLISEELERKMLYAQKISSLVHSIRKKERLRVRQPLSTIIIPVDSVKKEKEIMAVSEIILSEVNVKKIKVVRDNSNEIFVKKVKPNFKLLGAIHGPNMNFVSKKIFSMSAEDITEIENKGSIDITLENGVSVNILLEQVEITFGDIKGKSVATNELFTIALDTELDDDLLGEGVSREFINKVQNERKNISLDVTDKISIYINKSSSFIFESLMKHKTFICSETQALDFRIIDEIITSNKVEFDLGRKMDKDSICFKISKS